MDGPGLVVWAFKEKPGSSWRGQFEAVHILLMAFEREAAVLWESFWRDHMAGAWDSSPGDERGPWTTAGKTMGTLILSLQDHEFCQYPQEFERDLEVQISKPPG